MVRFGGWISDRIGRVRTFQIGYAIIILWAVPMWFMLDTASLPLFALAPLMAFQARLNVAPDRAARNDVTLSDPKMGAVIRTCAAVLFRDNGSGSDTVSLPTGFRPSARAPSR